MSEHRLPTRCALPGRPTPTAAPPSSQRPASRDQPTNRARSGVDTVAADRITLQRSGLRQEPADPVFGGLNGQSIARRLTGAARPAGIKGRVAGNSGRISLAISAYRPWRQHHRDDSLRGVGNRPMVAHYSAAATADRGAVAKYLAAACAETRVRL